MSKWSEGEGEYANTAWEQDTQVWKHFTIGCKCSFKTIQSSTGEDWILKCLVFRRSQSDELINAKQDFFANLINREIERCLITSTTSAIHGPRKPMVAEGLIGTTGMSIIPALRVDVQKKLRLKDTTFLVFSFTVRFKLNFFHLWCNTANL